MEVVEETEEKSPTMPQGVESDYPEESKTEEAASSDLLTENILKEEERLQKESAKEENAWEQQKSQSFREMESEEIREQRYGRLQYLLKKSNMYTSYLLERMEKQAAEAKEKQLKKEKKLEKERKMKEEAASKQKEEQQEKEDKKENVPVSPVPNQNTSQDDESDKQKSDAVVETKSIASESQESTSSTPRQTRRSMRLALEVQSPNSQNKKVTPSRTRGRKRKATSEATDITNFFKVEVSNKKSKLEDNNAESGQQNPGELSKDNVDVNTDNSESQTTATEEIKDDKSGTEDCVNKDEAKPDSTDTGVNSNQQKESGANSDAKEGDAEPQAEGSSAGKPGQPVLLTGATLRDYQLEGFHWLKILYENGVNGILADEMGLGKTIQCISIIAHLTNMGVPGPFLIVAPLSTLPNWLNEFQRFTPKVPVVLYHGSKEERLGLRNKIAKKYPIRKGVEVMPSVITSYEVSMKDRKLLQSFHWRYLIVDEGHRIKNNQCRLIRELKMYKSTNRLLLTGTPLQNNLSELWSLLNFLLPDIFDDLGSFEAWFDIDYLESEGADEHIVVEEKKKNILGMLHQILTPFMLRRLKSDVDLQIPPKREILLFCPLSKQQQNFYRKVVDGSIVKEMEDKKGKHKVEFDDKGRPVRKSKKTVKYLETGNENDETDDVEQWMENLLKQQQQKENEKKESNNIVQTSKWNLKLTNVMMMLRHVCNHPYLIEWPLDPKTGEFELNEKIIQASGKLLMLDRILPELKKRGHKVLIFSQMTKILNILEDFCFLRKFKYCRLDGSMHVEDRKDQMEEFNTDEDTFIFLLSTKAGGLGINLVAADTVIIFDSDWNPQGDLQAQDRCHRIGQTKPVIVYRMVAANTIDHKIVERAAAKRKLEKMVIHKGKFKGGKNIFQSSITSISPDELMKLLKSTDYDEVKGDDKEMMSEEDLQKLLDRSDLYRIWQEKTLEVNGKGSASETETPNEEESSTVVKDVEGLFKVIDDDCGKGYLSSKDVPADS